MKRTLFLLIVLFSASCVMKAQGPSSKWPYLYDTFTTGVVRSQDGSLLNELKLNVCITDGSLHYVSGDVILAAKMITVFSAKIGDDVFLRAGGKMMKVLAETEGAAVLELVEVDAEKMEGTNIGYGISSKTASSTQMTNLAVAGGVVNMNLYDAMAGKGEGIELPLKTSYTLLVGNHLIPATKTAVLNFDGVDKASANKFIKDNKIKWKNPASLLKVAVFIKEYE